MSVRIITDSTVDLTPEVKARVKTVPLSLRFGEEEYQDGVTITPEEFYERLVKSEILPTTSQPTPAAFEDVFREAVEAGDEVVCITIASKLSGTYQSATIAAEEFPGNRFRCAGRICPAAGGSGHGRRADPERADRGAEEGPAVFRGGHPGISEEGRTAQLHCGYGGRSAEHQACSGS